MLGLGPYLSCCLWKMWAAYVGRWMAFMWRMLEVGLSQSPSGMGPQSFSHVVAGGSREEMRKAERQKGHCPPAQRGNWLVCWCPSESLRVRMGQRITAPELCLLHFLKLTQWPEWQMFYWKSHGTETSKTGSRIRNQISWVHTSCWSWYIFDSHGWGV